MSLTYNVHRFHKTFETVPAVTKSGQPVTGALPVVIVELVGEHSTLTLKYPVTGADEKAQQKSVDDLAAVFVQGRDVAMGDFTLLPEKAA